MAENSRPVRCLYAILGVPRDASTDDIQKAYKRLALTCHPDKNIGNEAEATVRFREVNEAKKVLCDPSERRWYDEHREYVLSGGYAGDSDGSAATQRIVPNLYPFFSVSIFSDYSDGPTGFYGVYSSIFNRIHSLEMDHDSNISPLSAIFGSSTSSVPVVESFYSHWSSFSTHLSFTWLDQYNHHDSSNNRDIRRSMMKENEKFRNSGRKDYSTQVKQLVLYVRNRDVRVTTMLSQSDESKLKKKDSKLKKKKKILLDDDDGGDDDDDVNVNYIIDDEDDVVDELNRVDLNVIVEEEEEKVYPIIENSNQDYDNADVEEEEVVLGCVICERNFDTEAQLDQHLASKIHKKNLRIQTRLNK